MEKKYVEADTYTTAKVTPKKKGEQQRECRSPDKCLCADAMSLAIFAQLSLNMASRFALIYLAVPLPPFHLSRLDPPTFQVPICVCSK